MVLCVVSRRIVEHLEQPAEDHLVDEEAGRVTVVVDERQSQTVGVLVERRLVCNTNSQLSAAAEKPRDTLCQLETFAPRNFTDYDTIHEQLALEKRLLVSLI